jgi:hypothetical protein
VLREKAAGDLSDAAKSQMQLDSAEHFGNAAEAP